jgi:hypothetical protein
MSIPKIIESLLQNSDRVTSYVLLLAMVGLLGYVVYALAFGKIPTPGDHKRLQRDRDEHKARADSQAEMIEVVRKELVDARILHSASLVRIEFLERDVRLLTDEKGELRSRIARLESELDGRKALEWRQSSGNPQE